MYHIARIRIKAEKLLKIASDALRYIVDIKIFLWCGFWFFFSFCLLFYMGRREGNIRIHYRNFTFSWSFVKEIIGGGTPSLARQGLASVSTIFLNVAAGNYGDAAIAAMSVVSRVMNLATSVVTGFGQGFQPVCGFNYGAFLYDRVKAGFWFCVKVATGVLLVLAVLGFVLAPQVIQLFSKTDPQVLDIGVRALRYQCVTFPLVGWITLCNMMLQTIGKSVRASIMAMSRQGLFFIPAVLILPLLLGITGLMLAQPISDLLSFLIAIPLEGSVLQEMTRKQKEAKRQAAAAQA